MLAINMADVVNVLNTCKPYLIGFGIVLAIALIVLIAAFKLKKTKRKLVRSQAGIAILLALVIVVNMICWGPMSSMISLATGNGTISEETSNEATKLVEKIAEEGIVLLKNEDNMLPMENNKKLNVFGWASTNPTSAMWSTTTCPWIWKGTTRRRAGPDGTAVPPTASSCTAGGT